MSPCICLTNQAGAPISFSLYEYANTEFKFPRLRATYYRKQGHQAVSNRSSRLHFDLIDTFISFILHAKKTAFVIEHDFIMATYLADRVIVFEGEPSLRATSTP